MRFSAPLTQRNPLMAVYNRGEVWLTDFGYAGKTRPCLILSIPAGGDTLSAAPDQRTPALPATGEGETCSVVTGVYLYCRCVGLSKRGGA
jgi:hypothetical protein